LYAFGVHFDEVRPHGLKIAGNANRNVFRLVGAEVVELDGAKLLDHDRVRPGRCRLEVEAVAVQRLGNLPGLSVVGEKAYWTVAVREEIDGVADPHGVVIVGVVTGNLGNTGVLQVGNPNGSGLAAVIPLPGLLPLNMRNVGQASAVGRKRSFRANRDGQLRGKPARDGYRIELKFEVTETISPGDVQNLLAVGCPAENILVGGMVSESLRHTAGCRHHEYIAVTVVFSREGDHRSIRRKAGRRLVSHPRSQAAGIAAVAADDPQVAAIVENNLRFADRRKSQQQGRIALGDCKLSKERN